jgi:glycerophosphoryl diester phosphodiesterase
MRRGAPHVERWRSFPDVGVRWREHIPRVGLALLRHRSPHHAAYLARELAGAARDLRTQRPEGLARVGGMPWRELLPARLRHLCNEVAAAAVCIHHWLLTPRLVEMARTLRLPVVAWTVNDEAALRRAVSAGPVDMVTTDDVSGMRVAWHAQAAARAASAGLVQLSA